MGLTISCNPCPALPCPVLPCPPRPHGLGTWPGGRVDGWLAWAGLGGWIEWKGEWVGGWVEGSTSGQEWSPSPEYRCFSPHQAKRGLGLETRCG